MVSGGGNDGGALGRARGMLDDYLALLEGLVALESPSGDAERNGRLASRLAREIEARGGRTELRAAPDHGEHLVARFTGASRGGSPLLVLGHMDTVHPVGTLRRCPFRVEDDAVRGPGVFDMKGGLAVVIHALDLLRGGGSDLPSDVVFLVTCDEEVGSPTSRPLIEELAREARATLVMEPCAPGGAAKTRRKGVAGYRLRVSGRPAHAGIEPEAGASAVHELARLVVRVLELADDEAGTTVNVGVVDGGTAGNVVAAEASARVDVRFWVREEAERVDGAVRGLEPADTRCALTVEGGVNRWPLERTPESARLYETARETARGLGFDLPQGRTGGASDGNFTSGVGCPTLDGMGPDGGGAHSLDEHVRLSDIPRRIALTAGLLGKL